jgi:hypothetical protein
LGLTTSENNKQITKLTKVTFFGGWVVVLTIGLVKSIIKKSGSVGYFHLLFHLYDF